MTGPRPQLAGPWLLGRQAECAAIDRLLGDARAGSGGALVVRGEAGIGKSALLEYARQQAGPMLVLSTVGVEAESDLAFAGLHELLRPVFGCLGALPEAQSQALAGALGLAPSAQADRLLISAAVLGLLAAAAEDRPTLCVVDDAGYFSRRRTAGGRMRGSPRRWTPVSGTFRRATWKKLWPGTRGCPHTGSSRCISRQDKFLHNGTRWRPPSAARSPPGATGRCRGSGRWPPADHNPLLACVR
jgi:hypothetical protein